MVRAMVGSVAGPGVGTEAGAIISPVADPAGKKDNGDEIGTKVGLPAKMENVTLTQMLGKGCKV